MAKYKIIYDREACIGAASCEAVAPEVWKLVDDNKANLVGGTINEETGKWELEISEEQYELIQESADVCPVDIIEVVKIED